MEGKAIGRGLIIGLIAYVLVALAGAFFGIAIFPDPSLGIVALGKVMFAFAFIVILAVITAFAPEFLK